MAIIISEGHELTGKNFTFQIETLKKTITEVATKCDDLEKENRELKIVNNYERTNSVKLSKSANEQADEHKREFNRLKLQYTIVCKEKDSLEKELDSFQKLTERLNARLLQLAM